MTAPRIAARVDLDTKAAEDALKKLGQTGKRSFTEINSALDLAGKAFGVLRSAVAGAVREVATWVKAANEAEKAQRGLATALALQGDRSAQTLQRIQEFNAGLQQQIGLDDDAVAAIQTKLLALGVLPGKLEAATKATLGLADATGKDATRAAKEVAKAFEEGGAKAQRLEALFAVTEAQARTFAGQVQILETNWGALFEKLGDVIIQSPEVKKLLEETNDVVRDLNNEFDTGRPKIEAWFDSAIRGTKNWFKTFADEYAKAGGVGPAAALGAAIRTSFGGPKGRELVRTSNDLVGPEAPEFVGPPLPENFVPPAPSDTKKKKTKTAGRASSFSQQDIQAALPIIAPNLAWLEAEIELQKEIFARKQEFERVMLDETIAKNEERFQVELAAFEKRRELKDKEAAAEKQFLGQMISITNSGWGSIFSTLGAQIRQGSLDAGALLENFLGQMAQQFGTYLMAMGSAAVAAGLLGTVAPVFGALLGGPAAIAAGLGLIAAGGLLAGFGGGAAASAPATRTAPSAPSFPQTSEQRGFTNNGEKERGATVINVNFDRGFVTGTPRQVARTIREIVREGDTLIPART